MDNKTTAGLAVVVFLAIVGGTAFHVYGGTKYVVGLVKPDHAAELNKSLSIQVANDRAQLPLKIDADTTLVDETATGTQITYTYTLAEAAIALPFVLGDQGCGIYPVLRLIRASS